MESLLVWPKITSVVTKRINGFARPFLAKCHRDGLLDRLQIYSVDFVNDDFISACIGLNQGASAVQEPRLVEITWKKFNKIRWIRTNDLKISQCEDHICWKWENYKWGITPYLAAHLLQVYSLNVKGNYKIEDDLFQQGVRFAKRLIEYVDLISVRDLKVDGIFETERLVFGFTYKVGFLIKLRSTATGWENRTKLTLRLPNGSLQQRRASFNDMPKGEFVQIYAGEFKMSPNMVGKLEFSMENNNEVEKTGMCINLAFIHQQH